MLYEQYGSNKLTLTILKSGDGTYHFAKLQAALEDLNSKKDLVPKPIVIEEYVPDPEPAPGKKNLDFKTAPEQLIEIRNDKTKRYAQARKLHETIRILDSQDHRLAAALELLDHMDYVNNCWEAIDKFMHTGELITLPQEEKAPAVVDLSLAKLLRERANLPSYASKAKKAAESAKTAASKLKYTMRFEWFEKRLLAVNERLKNELV